VKIAISSIALVTYSSQRDGIPLRLCHNDVTANKNKIQLNIREAEAEADLSFTCNKIQVYVTVNLRNQ